MTLKRNHFPLYLLFVAVCARLMSYGIMYATDSHYETTERLICEQATMPGLVSNVVYFEGRLEDDRCHYEFYAYRCPSARVNAQEFYGVPSPIGNNWCHYKFTTYAVKYRPFVSGMTQQAEIAVCIFDISVLVLLVAVYIDAIEILLVRQRYRDLTDKVCSVIMFTCLIISTICMHYLDVAIIRTYFTY